MAEEFNSLGPYDDEAPYHPSDEYTAVRFIQVGFEATPNATAAEIWDFIDALLGGGNYPDNYAAWRCARELLPFYFLDAGCDDLP